MSVRTFSLRRTGLALALLAALHGTAAAAAVDAAAPAPAPADAAAVTTKTLESVSVIGQGESRQVQRITSEDVKILPPGTSPLKVLQSKPGVHFESADPFGNYEWSTRISLRGFNQNRLGFTLDGIPLGDMSYGNQNGLHISRALIAENLGGAELAEGIGALGTPSTSDLGGTIQFYSSDPASEFGVTVAQGFGSDSARRTYARLDTGDHDGFAMYLSGAYSSTDKWKGHGAQKQKQFNGKAIYNFGDSSVGALLTTSSRDETDYQDLSLSLQKRLGWNWDNYSPDWNRAVNAAKSIYSGGVTTLDDAYYDARGLRDDTVASVFGDFALSDDLRLKTTTYSHNDRGQGHWFTPYQASYPGTPQETPISIRTTEYGIDRGGVTAALNWNIGIHHLEGGFWYEDSNHNVQRNYYFITGPLDDTFFLRNPNLRLFHQHYETTTRQLYLQDSFKLLDDRLAVDVGFKSPDSKVTARAMPGTLSYGTTGSYANGSLTAKKNFLPQVGASYQLGGGNELFGSYAKNIAAYQAGITGPLATTQAAFDLFGRQLKPEQSRTFEGGLRRVTDSYQASLALYDVKFDNRLLVIAQCSGIVGCPSAYANVGSVSSRGAELAVNVKLSPTLHWSNSLSYNRSRYDSDYLNGTTLVATKGKTVVDSPKQLFFSELAWTPGAWDLRISANYTGKRYYTYTNDASVPSFWVVNAAAAYDFGKLGGSVQDLRLALNVSNLLDKRYFATIGSNGFTASDPTGGFQTLLPGSPRAAMLTATLKF
ncbi:TonB-dependent receptor [Rhodanobacter glycinis]|uniref:TonB-dependent receptor n=1 Tax=Rhodanobacter glycinis TaxID=582702 RepID=A0A502CCV4_9GAMM|nr:TonB-dependent receptor [Rhodanobacter glycinis]TPG11475.1 TonB-dependent receptor [Rhodanobacter glycinis]